MEDQKKDARERMRELEQSASKLAIRYFTSITEDPKVSEITKKLFSTIGDVTRGYWEKFEDERRNIGKSHGMRNLNNSLSHFGVMALQKGDAATANEVKKLMDEATDLLKEFSLPEDIAWGFDSSADQERAEFLLLIEIFPFLSIEHESNQSLKMPSNEDLNMTPQSWLSGLGDAVTELGKLHRKRMGEHGLNKKTRLAMRERYVEIAEGIREALGKFETAYAMVINNSRGRHFGSTFRGLLARIDRVIESEMDKISLILDSMDG